MAQVSKDQVNEVVARVMQEVAGEVEAHEGAFGVSDLSTQLADLARVGGEAAWTISYSTSSQSIEQLRDVARVGGEAAWTITYSTSSSPIVDRGLAKRGA